MKKTLQMKTTDDTTKQAGAELGQAQLKLEMEWNLFHFRFVALSWLTIKGYKSITWLQRREGGAVRQVYIERDKTYYDKVDWHNQYLYV